MLAAYQLYYQLIDTKAGDMAKNIDEVGITVITAVMCLSMALLSYDDELILFY